MVPSAVLGTHGGFVEYIPCRQGETTVFFLKPSTSQYKHGTIRLGRAEFSKHTHNKDQIVKNGNRGKGGILRGAVISTAITRIFLAP